MGDDNVVDGEASAPFHRLAGDLAAQLDRAGRVAIVGQQLGLTAHGIAHQPGDRRQRQVCRRWRCAAKTAHAAVGLLGMGLHVLPEQRIDCHRHRCGKGRGRRRQRATRADVKTGLGPGFDQAAVLQQAESLLDGRQADLATGTQLAQGRQAVAMAQRAGGNLSGNVVGQALIEGKRRGHADMLTAVRRLHRDSCRPTGPVQPVGPGNCIDSACRYQSDIAIFT